MANSVQKYKKMTVAEFLDWVEAQSEPYELVGGVPRPMWKTIEDVAANGNVDHGYIGDNVLIALSAKIKSDLCRPCGSKVAVTVLDEDGEDAVVYPDVSVDCGFMDRAAQARTARKPVLVVEVLSPSTRDYDLGGKRLMYEATPTIERILFIEQSKMLVMLHSRQSDGAWLSRFFSRSSDIIEISTLGISLTVHEIYEDVKFPIKSKESSADRRPPPA